MSATTSSVLRSLTVFLALVVAAALVCGPAAAAGAVCPDSELQFNGGTPFTSSAAVFDTVLSTGKELAYDLPAGTLLLRAEGKFWTIVKARDRFVVVGLPAGTPVPLVAELTVAGTIGSFGCGGSNCWGYLGARITHGATEAGQLAQENIFGSPPRPVSLAVQLPLALVAGVETPLEFEIYAYGSADHWEQGAGSFRFTGLPAGASIQSCQGYVDAPTPALPASWGRVKAAYR